MPSLAASIASLACVYTVHKNLGMTGIGVLVGFVVLALIVQVLRRPQSSVGTS